MVCAWTSNLLHEGGDNGAETITWGDAGDSLYLLSVYHYSGDSFLKSEARVTLYSSGSPTTIEVPTKEPNKFSR